MSRDERPVCPAVRRRAGAGRVMSRVAWPPPWWGRTVPSPPQGLSPRSAHTSKHESRRIGISRGDAADPRAVLFSRFLLWEGLLCQGQRGGLAGPRPACAPDHSSIRTQARCCMCRCMLVSVLPGW